MNLEGANTTDKIPDVEETSIHMKIIRKEAEHHKMEKEEKLQDEADFINIESHEDIPGHDGSLSKNAHFAPMEKKTGFKAEMIVACQIVILYVVIIACILNLSFHNGDSNLWTALLSSSLGLMLPGPATTFKFISAPSNRQA